MFAARKGKTRRFVARPVQYIAFSDCHGHYYLNSLGCVAALFRVRLCSDSTDLTMRIIRILFFVKNTYVF